MIIWEQEEVRSLLSTKTNTVSAAEVLDSILSPLNT